MFVPVPTLPVELAALIRSWTPTDVPEARFWIVSGLATIRELSRGGLNRNAAHGHIHG